MNRKKIYKAVQKAILDWQVNDVILTVEYRKPNKEVRCLVDVVTDAVMDRVRE